ncbi:MAG: 30S ribosome-binding factor RbfA [Oscillospiraceae bacterium]|jgi:ribosome-binding factor A|nr:30S ribosome-binding factor RbfA [Oscillospiraceae bacterium]
MSFYVERTAEDIHRHLTDIFRDLKDPRIDRMITIIHIDLSADLSDCKVYVSCLGGLAKAQESVKGLTQASGFIKRELFSRLKAKKCPSLTFIADDSVEKSREMLEKIEKLNK